MAQAYLQEIIKKPTTAGEMVDFLFSNGDKIGCGKFPPKFARVGEYYSYEVEMRGQYKNLKNGTFAAMEKPAGVAPPAAPAPSTGGYSGGGRNSDTQKVISRQAATNTAVAWITLLQDADALPIPKVKTDKKADLMEGLLHEYMDKFHTMSTHEPFDFGAVETGSDLNLADLEDKEQWSE